MEGIRNGRKAVSLNGKKYGPMRYSNCNGSYKCTNETRPFRPEYGVINRTQFKRNPTGEEICRICEGVGEYVPCTARRYIKEGKKSVRVFPLGTHTCPVLSKPEKPKEKVKEMFKKNSKLTPSEIQSSLVMSAKRGRLGNVGEYSDKDSGQKVDLEPKTKRQERNSPQR